MTNGSQSSSMTGLRPIAGLTTAVTVLLAGWIVVHIVTVLLELGYPDALGGQADGPARPYGIAGLVRSVYTVATGIVFIVWLERARSNAERLSPLRHRRSRPWLFWGWIVPVVGLWFGYQMVDDVRRASDPNTRQLTNPLKNNSSLLGWWWGTFLVGLTGPSFFVTAQGNTQPMASAVLLPVAIGAAVLAIRVVRSIRDMQQAPA